MTRFIKKRYDRLLSQRFKDRVWRKAEEYVDWKIKQERQEDAHSAAMYFLAGLFVGIAVTAILARSVI